MSSFLIHGPENAAAPFSVPSPAIWGRWPSDNAMRDPSNGFLIHEDFRAFPAHLTNTQLPFKEWNGFLSDGATILPAGIANRSAVTMTADGDNEAAMLVLGSASVQVTKYSKRKVAFEGRFRSSTIADNKHGIFLGLHESITPSATSIIVDAGTLADENFIGFHRLEGDGDQMDIVWKADGQTQQGFTDVKVLVADTFVKMGFLFDGDETLKFFINGVEYLAARLGDTELGAATFPSDINLTPAFGIKNATLTTPGSTTWDWIRFGYVPNDGDGWA